MRQDNGSGRLKLLMIPIDAGTHTIESEKAFGIPVNDTRVWLPKSQIQDVEDQTKEFKCWCPVWLIEDKGLDMFIDTSHEPRLF